MDRDFKSSGIDEKIGSNKDTHLPTRGLRAKKISYESYTTIKFLLERIMSFAFETQTKRNIQNTNHMLSSISWQEFITALVTIVVIYYGVATLLLYRKELINLFTRQLPASNSERRVPEQSENKTSMMGATVNEGLPDSPHAGSEHAEEIIYAPSDDLPDEVGSSDFEQQQMILSEQLSELIEAIKTTCAEITRMEISMPESLAMFGRLLSQYPRLRDSLYRESITDYVHSMTQSILNGPLSLAQIDEAWNASPES
jgi:hypothetical protein